MCPYDSLSILLSMLVKFVIGVSAFEVNFDCWETCLVSENNKLGIGQL